MSDEDLPSYAVGYGRPPQATRFRKGRSGNPKGRSKGTKSASAVIRAALQEKVEITLNGRKRVVSLWEAGAMKLARSCAQGDVKAFSTIITLDRLLGGILTDSGPSDVTSDEATRKVFEAFLADLKADGSDG